ncbi:50S ribosomal protein L21 [candidate division KSB1 bacterium]|nr:MAG: 50S ribosomal protein L21 [candidate division KSB1 bacterium]
MYAIVEIAGYQYKIEKGSEIKVPRLNLKEGSEIEFDNVLLVKNNNNIMLGRPIIKGASIKAKVLEHGKEKKIIVFKKKRRKDYKVTRGHRQQYSKIKIEDIKGV